jgi:hypothetical protein
MIVAQEIMNQLRVLGQVEMMSWGSHAFKALKENQLKESFGGHRGALIFKVQGYLFKGHVAVVLMPDDTYTVRFGSLRKGLFASKEAISDVYFDNLVYVIDSKVETK